MISDSNDERQEENVNVELRAVSNKFVWQNIGSFPASWETFCSLYGIRNLTLLNWML
jgi:hypothetical protein